jgi:hypothetical protein
VHEEQFSHVLGRGIFLDGNKVCHVAKSIKHHHDHIKSFDGGKFTMISMDTLSHDHSKIGNDRNNHVCFLLNV